MKKRHGLYLVTAAVLAAVVVMTGCSNGSTSSEPDTPAQFTLTVLNTSGEAIGGFAIFNADPSGASPIATKAVSITDGATGTVTFNKSLITATTYVALVDDLESPSDLDVASGAINWTGKSAATVYINSAPAVVEAFPFTLTVGSNNGNAITALKLEDAAGGTALYDGAFNIAANGAGSIALYAPLLDTVKITFTGGGGGNFTFTFATGGAVANKTVFIKANNTVEAKLDVVTLKLKNGHSTAVSAWSVTYTSGGDVTLAGAETLTGLNIAQNSSTSVTINRSNLTGQIKGTAIGGGAGNNAFATVEPSDFDKVNEVEITIN
jgi:hypothetical protein